MTQLERIAAMEAAYDRARAALADGRSAEDELRVLAAYMDCGDWLADYQADEQGRIPSHIKRGVLSQDGLYNLLADAESSPGE